jgi:hypothetical protein
MGPRLTLSDPQHDQWFRLGPIALLAGRSQRLGRRQRGRRQQRRWQLLFRRRRWRRSAGGRRRLLRLTRGVLNVASPDRSFVGTASLELHTDISNLQRNKRTSAHAAAAADIPSAAPLLLITRERSHELAQHSANQLKELPLPL